MSQRDFMTAVSRLSFQAGTLAARGGEYLALEQLNLLIDHFDTLITYPSADTFSPFTSPLVDDGTPFFSPSAITPTPSLPKTPQAAEQPRRTRKQTGFYFKAPHTLDAPPPHPNPYDTTRKDRPFNTVYPAVNPREGFDVHKTRLNSDSSAASNHDNAEQIADR